MITALAAVTKDPPFSFSMLGLARLLLVVLLSILPLFLVMASSSSDPPRSAPGSHPSTTATVSKQQPKSAGSDDPRTKEEASVSSRSLGVADRDDSSRTSSQEASISSKSSTANNDPHDDADMMIKIVFSDVDGTLVHYDSRMETAHSQGSSIQHEVKEDVPTLVHLPPSATGTQGVISARTLQLCRNIRAQGIPLVLVSGMRTSTLLQRLPYLPKADAYCSEGGSRIFYPSTQPQQKGLQVVPVSFHGATPQDLEPFHLVEDLEWRRQIVKAIGLDGFIGNDITDLVAMEKHPIIPLESRSGPLWELANRLRKDGYILDLKGYAACFRVNRKQQPTSLSSVRFDDLLSGNDVAIPLTISTSTNLGCVDFYPAMSGKKNWYVRS